MLGKYINHCEDSLTAAVLTHLLHLPSEVFWTLLRQACGTNGFREGAGELQAVELWPSWNSRGTDNTDRVVPDAFIRFRDFDLIIEAKRWDGGGQSEDQWRNELTAYANEYAEENRPVELLALGGIHAGLRRRLEHEWSAETAGSAAPSKVQKRTFYCPVHHCHWGTLLRQCKRMHHQLGLLDYPDSQTFAARRILDHVIDLFSWHGISTGTWLAESIGKLPRLSPVPADHLGMFRSISSRLISP